MYHITSYISHHIIYHNTSHHISHHIISYIYIYIYHVISYHIYHITSYIIISYIISYHITSHHVSYIVYHIISYHISCHVMSYHVSYHMLYHIIYNTALQKLRHVTIHTRRQFRIENSVSHFRTYIVKNGILSLWSAKTCKNTYLVAAPDRSGHLHAPAAFPQRKSPWCYPTGRSSVLSAACVELCGLVTVLTELLHLLSWGYTLRILATTSDRPTVHCEACLLHLYASLVTGPPWGSPSG